MTMKKLVYVIFLAVVIPGLVIFFKKGTNPQKILGTTNETPSPAKANEENKIDFDFDSEEVSVSWFEVKDSSKIILIPNFKEKETATDIAAKNSCKMLTSGGFYSKDDKPSGFFLSEGKIFRNWQENHFLNGVYSINSFDIPRITQVPPQDSLRVAIQSGPELKENAEFTKLSIRQDKPARRIVLATTGSNSSVFLVFYNKSSVYLGPFLSKLPEALKIFEEKSGISLADAINLDGGSASAFYSEGVSLPELSPVGSFFCWK